MATKMKLKKRRVFNETFKKSRVKEYEKGTFTVLELSRHYQIQSAVLYRWIRKYSVYNQHQTRIVVEPKSLTKVNQALKEQIKALEAALGRKQLEIEYLEKVVEISSKDIGIDLKKKLGTKFWNTSANLKDGK